MPFRWDRWSVFGFALVALTGCGGGGGSAGSSEELAAGGGRAGSAVVDLKASADTVAAGSRVTLTWRSRGTIGCTASDGWSGERARTGSESVGPLNTTTTFTLSCPGASGNAYHSVTVQVSGSAVPTPTPPGAAAVSASLQPSPAWVPAGGSSTLTWTSQGATSCTASGGWSGARGLSGSATVGPVASDTTYTLTCTGAGGTAISSTTVATRTARLSWEPSADLGDVSGFRLRYGTQSGTYLTTVDINDPRRRSHTLNLQPGTYYFAIAPINASGAEGTPSNEVSKSIL